MRHAVFACSIVWLFGATAAEAQPGPRGPNLPTPNLPTVSRVVRPSAGIPYDPRPSVPTGRPQSYRPQTRTPTINPQNDMYLRMSDRVVQVKYCSVCGGTVPYHTSHNGQRCPHCQVHWGAPRNAPAAVPGGPQPQPKPRIDEQIAANVLPVETESTTDQTKPRPSESMTAGISTVRDIPVTRLLAKLPNAFLEVASVVVILIAATAAIFGKRRFRRAVRV